MMKKEKLRLFFAPLQGYTDWVYRRIHYELVGGLDEYFTPFLRWEGDGLRNKDLRDVLPDNNVGVPVTPQLIAAGVDELSPLLDVLEGFGYKQVDLNLGCPFPLQTGRGRGAALLEHPERVATMMEEMERRSGMEVSVKMRCGMTSIEEGMHVMEILNNYWLRFVCIHARLGKQQYKGDIDIDTFAAMKEMSSNPVVYNGDVRSVEDLNRLLELFPDLYGVMIGRGLLARPSLANEWCEGIEIDENGRRSLAIAMHGRLYDDSCRRMQGEQQVLGRMRAFWEYQEPLIERKLYKRLMKAGNLRNYEDAVRSLV